MNGHRALSSRECENIETAISRICLAMGRSEKDSDLRQAAWTAILSAYRKAPEGFLGCHTWGWQQAYRLAGEAIADELRFRWQRLYRNRSLDQPLPGNPDGTLHQLLPSSSGPEDRVCFYDYLTRCTPMCSISPTAYSTARPWKRFKGIPSGAMGTPAGPFGSFRRI